MKYNRIITAQLLKGGGDVRPKQVRRLLSMIMLACQHSGAFYEPVRIYILKG